MSSIRVKRVSNLIQKKITYILHKDINNPNLGFVTITYVKVSKDLRYAKIFFSVLGDDSQIAQSTNILKNLTTFFRQRIGQEIRLKYTPQITFLYDQKYQEAQRIEELINKIGKKENG